MPDAPVLVERSGPKLTLTLNRPEVINAFNADVFRIINEALDNAERDAEIHVVVLRAIGRGFSSGLDRKAMETMRSGDGEYSTFFDTFYGLMRRVDAFPKPVIALIHGHCIAAGAQLATAADIVIAGESLRLFEPELRGGFWNTEDWPRRLARTFGPATAKLYMMWGEPFSADQALKAGLVSMVVPDDELTAIGDGVADRLATFAPDGVSKALAVVDDEVRRSR